MKEENIEKIFESQKEYFLSDSTLDIDFRIRNLKALKQEIINNEEQIQDALFKDLHKSAEEAYITEIGILISEINLCVKKLSKWTKAKKVRSSLSCFPSKAKIISQPYGVVLIISPWNYPFQLSLSPLIGAIASGNTAIIKPAEYSPNTSLIIKKITDKIYDSNYIKTIIGGKDENQRLLDLSFDYIFFTGSPKLGKLVMEKASKNLVPITLELGGKSPCIVDKTADIKLSAKRIAFGKFLNSGQTCIAPDHIFIHKDIKEEFIKEIIVVINSFYTENEENSKDYGRIINELHFDRLSALLDNGDIIYGGKINRDNKFISPTLIENIRKDSELLHSEIFGPILPIISFENIETLIASIRIKPKPLALYIFSNSKQIQNKIISKISSGGVCVNDTIMHIVPENLPFGGVGNSGMGAYHGKKSFETFSHQRSVLIRKNWLDITLRYPPFNKKKQSLIKKLI
ncbi:MAG: aldehyde dehydrogenase [Bacteroidales bacterium]|nr:aldehyde dehydrogenase [Bacteroidales bacterium]